MALSLISPPRLKVGSHLRIIDPTFGIDAIAPDILEEAACFLEELFGFTTSFSRTGKGSIAERIEQIHHAFIDPEVDVIMAVIGGYSSNSLLDHLDYDLIRRHPKVLCGFSDITALSNAILTRSGLITYSGPFFCTFGMKEGLQYISEYFRRCVMESVPFEVRPSFEWSDDRWWLYQSERAFNPNTGPSTIREGVAEGICVGGNLCTLNLLQGTHFFPPLEGSVLFIEEDSESSLPVFERDLQSLISVPQFSGVQGIVIGRFQQASHITACDIQRFLEERPSVGNIPIIVDVDFGHTYPFFTFPIGGVVRVSANAGSCRIDILDH